MKLKSGLKALVIICFTFFLLLNLASQTTGHFPFMANSPAQSGRIQSGVSCQDRHQILTDGQNRYPLGRHIDLLKDQEGTLTIDEVASPAFDRQFIPSQVDVPNYGMTSDVYWVRLCLDNQTRQTAQWLLDTGFPNMHFVDLYTPRPDGTGFDAKQTGVLRPLSTRDLLFHRIVFNLNVPARTQETVYLRFQNGDSMTLPLTLWRPESFSQRNAAEAALLGMFYGALLIMLVYHLFVLYTLRDPSYLYFVCFLTNATLFFASYDALAPLYLGPDQFQLNRFMVPVFVILSMVSLLLFIDSFLEIRARRPGLHKLILFQYAAWAILLVLVPVVSYHMIANLFAPLALLSTVTAVGAGLVRWQDGYRPAGFFLFSCVGFLIGIIITILVREGVLPSTEPNEYFFKLGLLWLAAFWSISLTDRINLLKSEAESANRALQRSEHKLEQILEGLPLGVVMYGKDRKPNYSNQRTYEILSNPEQGILPDLSAGRTPEMVIRYYSLKKETTERTYPLTEFPIHSALGGEPAYADDIVANLGDRRIPLEVWASPIRDNLGTIESAVVAFQDITRRKQADAELAEYRRQLEALVEKRTADLSAINDWLNTINEVHQTLGGGKDLPQAYQKMSATIAHLLEARAVFVVHWGEPVEHCEVHYESGEEFPVPQPVISRLKTSVVRDSVFFNHVDPLGKPIRLNADQRSVFSMVFEDRFSQEELQLFLLVPMVTHQTVGGLLGIVFRDPKVEIYHQQMLLMEKMALDVANLTQNAFLLDQSIDLATLEERQRIARDLHDSVTQMIYSASLFSSTLPQRIRRDPESAVETAVELHQLTRGALAEMRTLLLELRPAGITRMPLSELLVQLAQATSGRSDFSLDVDVDDVPLLPEDIQVVFYRIAQESLNNILKHANAKRVEIRLHASPSFDSRALEDWCGQIQLMVKDDGIGFDPETIEYEHFGLRIMQERADTSQAQYHLESKPGQGTKVSLVWRKA